MSLPNGCTQEFEQLREEVRNKNIEEINVLSATLDQQIEVQYRAATTWSCVVSSLLQPPTGAGATV